MLSLLLLRHAKSSHGDDLSDHDRPLNAKGLKAAPKVGQLLVAEKLLPELVLCSTATRTRQTLEGVIQGSEYDGPVEYEKELYLAEPASILTELRQVRGSPSRVMIVGHNPGLEELVALLTGRAERMPTAALANIGLPLESWAELGKDTRGNLVGFWRPKEIG